MIRSLLIASKDLKAEFRTKQMLNSMVIFSLLVIVIFSVSFGDLLGDSKIVTQLAPGVLWIAFTFAGMLGLSRSFAGELENGCLEGLKLCPIDRSAIYNGKIISNAVIMFLVEIMIIPLFAVMFNYSINGLPGLAIVIIFGTIGFISVGTLLSALTVNTSTRELLLPILLLPIIIPVIIPAVLATGKIFAGGDISDISGELRLLAVYDVIFLIIAQLVFEYAIGD
ncbi:MAG: heme exporter protein CcmB [Methanosarcinaceae archaeon]